MKDTGQGQQGAWEEDGAGGVHRHEHSKVDRYSKCMYACTTANMRPFSPGSCSLQPGHVKQSSWHGCAALCSPVQFGQRIPDAG